MKKLVLCIGVILGVTLVWAYQVPTYPAQQLTVTIISLEDAPEGKGWRRITVRMPDGEESVILTLTPFFYKPGYEATLGVYERFLFPDVYDFVAN